MFLFVYLLASSEKTSAPVKTHPPHRWVFGQRALALANRSVHSSSRAPFSFPNQVSRSAGRLPFHLGSCIFNPLLSSLPAHLRLCPARIVHMFIFPPTSSQTSFILPLIDPCRSAPLSLHQSSCPSLSSLSPKDKHSTGWTLSSSISLAALPADSVFAQGLGRALCH